MLRSLLYISILLLSVTANHRVKRIVGGRAAAKPPPDDPVVFAQIYDRYARIQGVRNNQTGIYTFLGLRYAEPPVGRNRFTRPLYRRLEGDLDATKHGPPCPQPDPYDPNRVIGNEDCLLLNVFTPKMPDESTGLPVYVWIHPGGFRYGSAAQYDAQPIAQSGVIFVPIQYRLGTLGIIGEGTKDFTGNIAMYDMTAALRWVNEYIQFFGGDPKQIKVIGHGSGAASAMYLSTSRLPRSGSVNGAVAMSGSSLSQYAEDTEPVQSVQEISMLNECPDSDNVAIIKCLREKSAEDIVSRDNFVETERLQGRAMVKGIAGSVGYAPHLEEPNDLRGLPGFYTEKTNITLKSGKFNKVPLLIGVTKHETGNGVTVNSVSKIFGTADKFLNSLKDSLKSLTSLLNVDGLTGEILKPELPGLGQLSIGLNDLLKLPPNLNPDEVLSKLTEATTDILFNLPAVLTAELWGRTASAFLYSFEYSGGSTNGINFLRGLKIVSENKNPNYTAHGDELQYLFDTNDIYGNKIPQAKLTGNEEKKVRENFIGLLKKFAYMDSESKTDSDNLLQSFTGTGMPFIKITSKLESQNNFRFCELSLYGAPVKAIQTTTCEALGSTLGLVTGGLGNLTSGLGLGKPLGDVGGIFG